MKYLHDEEISELSSDEWRRYGEKRRLAILNEDRQKGGAKFNINSSYKIDRYFQIIRRSLDQFYRMKSESDDLEKSYIMGHRILIFLRECLPRHPDFQKTLAFKIRNKSRKEALALERCLEDIALSIDERLCNQVIDYESEIDSFIMDDNDDVNYFLRETPNKETRDDGWVSFDGWMEDNKIHHVESSPATTLTTTGTGSIGPLDLSSSFEEVDHYAERRIDFSDYMESDAEESEEDNVVSALYESTSEEEDFLYKIANEEFSFESDSDADDSWAQDETDFSSTSECSYFHDPGLVCDPAQIAFGELVRQLPVKLNKQGLLCEGYSGRTKPRRKAKLASYQGNKDEYSRFDFTKDTNKSLPVKKNLVFHKFASDTLDADQWVDF